MTIILYGSPTKLSNAHKPVRNHGIPCNGGKQQPEYFVRMKCVGEVGDLEALDMARPMKGETVLNTIEL